MSESEFTAAVASRMYTLGFQVWTVNQTRRKPRQKTDPGVSDIIAFGHGATVFVETKMPGNEQSDDQRRFQDAVSRGGSLYWLIYDMEDLMNRMKVMGWMHE